MKTSHSILALLIGLLAAVAPAHAGEAFPLYNMDTYCRDISGGDFAKDVACDEKESGAYAKLETMWASIPEKRKVECHNVAYDANTGAGSYALHLECIDKGRK